MPTKHLIDKDEEPLKNDSIRNPTKEEITQLVIAVFHDHVTSLETYWNAALNPVLKLLSPIPFCDIGVPTLNEVIETLAKPTKNLNSILKKIYSNLQEKWSTRGISLKIWEKFINRLDDLQKYINNVNPGPHEFLSLQTLSHDIFYLLNEIKTMRVTSREPIKQALECAKEIERITCFYHLRQVEQRVIDLQQEAQGLRDLFLSNISSEDDLSIIPFDTLIHKAITILEPMSRSRRVELRVKEKLVNTKIKVIEKNVRRAITNLLSNAIKYSWTLRGEKWAWVDIRSGIIGKYVFLELENWGVPIESSEIETGRIFQFLSRGRYANDRARTGTGTGLWDSQSVAKSEGGEITIESFPARPTIEKTLGETPYITKVIFKIPYLKK